jgi:phage shock protein B
MDLVVIFTFVLLLVAMQGYFRLRRRDGASALDEATLADARTVAAKLEQRVEALERILDEDAPGWRSRARL